MPAVALSSPSPQTAQLQLRMQKMHVTGELPATVRVQTDKTIWKRTLMIPVRDQPTPSSYVTLQVPAGFYSVDVISPAGERITAEGEAVEGQAIEVFLKGLDSDHEWLSWPSYSIDQKFLRPKESGYDRLSRHDFDGFENYVSDTRRLRSDEIYERFEISPHRAPQSLREVMGPRGRVRFWYYLPDEGWVSLSTRGGRLKGQDEDTVLLGLGPTALPPGTPVLAEIAGNDSEESEFCMVPRGEFIGKYELSEVAVVVDTRSEASFENNIYSLRARTIVMNADFALLSGYLQLGDIKNLEAVGELIAPRIKMFLYDIENIRVRANMRDAEYIERIPGYPGQSYNIVATAAALALLKMRQFNLLHEWVKNSAADYYRIPDNLIVLAWTLLYAQGSEKIATREGESPQQLLILAASQGLPMFTESLRLLVSGLRLFNSSEDPQVRQHLEKLERYLWAADPNAIFTSFRAAAPSGANSNGLESSSSRRDWDLEWANP